MRLFLFEAGLVRGEFASIRKTLHALYICATIRRIQGLAA
jgi:hypothetical protein